MAASRGFPPPLEVAVLLLARLGGYLARKHDPSPGHQLIWQGYNAQVTTEGANQFIVATEVTANASDQGQMIAQLDLVNEIYRQQPETVLADADYANERDLAVEARGIDGYEALGRKGEKGGIRRPLRRLGGWGRNW